MRTPRHPQTTYDQAQRIAAKFGGEGALAKALGLNRTTTYRWVHDPTYKMDGLIPAQHVRAVQQAAQAMGIRLTPEDWAPSRGEQATTPPSATQA